MPNDGVICRQYCNNATMKSLLQASDEAMKALYPPQLCYLVDAETLLSDAYEFYILWQGESSAGCIGLGLRNDFIEIKRLFIDAAFRRTGRAQRLLSHGAACASARGYRELRLEVGTLQPEAIGLYKSLGFREISAYPPYEPHVLSRFFCLAL